MKLWHKHKWSKWIQYNVKRFSRQNPDIITEIELRQQRKCTDIKCGKVQDEVVAFNAYANIVPD